MGWDVFMWAEKDDFAGTRYFFAVAKSTAISQTLFGSNPKVLQFSTESVTMYC